mmetsp:Transcript_53385/g.173635  ORF Transcript_53385/g.173635 Transcript_53385/m.173635 type:complete len:300 (-) Transcript_53385:269-1168(-)
MDFLQSIAHVAMHAGVIQYPPHIVAHAAVHVVAELVGCRIDGCNDDRLHRDVQQFIKEDAFLLLPDIFDQHLWNPKDHGCHLVAERVDADADADISYQESVGDDLGGNCIRVSPPLPRLLLPLLLRNLRPATAPLPLPLRSPMLLRGRRRGRRRRAHRLEVGEDPPCIRLRVVVLLKIDTEIRQLDFLQLPRAGEQGVQPQVEYPLCQLEKVQSLILSNALCEARWVCDRNIGYSRPCVPDPQPDGADGRLDAQCSRRNLREGTPGGAVHGEGAGGEGHRAEKERQDEQQHNVFGRQAT